MSENDSITIGTIFSPTILKGLGEKNIEKRKLSLEELERLIFKYKNFINIDFIKNIINLLDFEFFSSTFPLLRKSGLMSISAIINGLGNTCDIYLEHFIPLILTCFTDQDASVRLSACETCLNIVNITQTNFLSFIDSIFISLTSLSVDADINVKTSSHALSHLLMDVFIRTKDDNIDKIFPLIVEYLFPANVQAKIFIISWVSFLVNYAPLNALKYLPSWFDGIFNIYTDSNNVLQSKVERLFDLYRSLLQRNSNAVKVSELMEILFIYTNYEANHVKMQAFKWIYSLLDIYEYQAISLIPYILNCVILYLSSKNQIQTISDKCKEINIKLKHLVSTESEIKNSNLIDFVTIFKIFKKWLNNENESTILMVIGWNIILIDTLPSQFLSSLSIIYHSILNCITSNSHIVIETSLVLVTKICTSSHTPLDSNEYFSLFVNSLIQNMVLDSFKILKNNSAYIIRTICNTIDPLIFYCKASSVILESIEKNKISTVVHHLNIILLTVDQTKSLRYFLIHDRSENKKEAFNSIFKCWAYNPASALTLCLLCGDYDLSYEIVKCFEYIETTFEHLLQFDHIVQMIESPIFTFLRVRLLDEEIGFKILKTLCGLLMILPQSSTFHILRKRLQCLSALQNCNIDINKPIDQPKPSEYINYFKQINKIDD